MVIGSSLTQDLIWIVQTGMFRDNHREEVVATLQRFSIPHIVTDLSAPIEIEDNRPIITNGSIMLSKIAQDRGWRPGSLINENFSYAVWYPILREHLLNRDGFLGDLDQVDPAWDRFFIRPISDTKTFAGQVIDRKQFQAWRAHEIERGISSSTPVLVAPVRPSIGQEHPHFIVDGKVVSSSRYRLGGAQNESPDLDRAVVEFATEIARLWSPARAFVLDTYQTRDHIGVVELGGIFHAGFYRADVQAIIMALNDMACECDGSGEIDLVSDPN